MQLLFVGCVVLSSLQTALGVTGAVGWVAVMPLVSEAGKVADVGGGLAFSLWNMVRRVVVTTAADLCTELWGGDGAGSSRRR